ncbi:MAG: CBS domain-containing protein [Chloroflexi bacterium]|nr:CBS domain-containing protein [Chloroflexota bacterium]
MKAAGDVMSQTVHLISPAANVAEASARMDKEHIHSLLVERANDVDAYGIITDTDIVRKVLAFGKDPAQTRVREVMSKPIITIPPDCPLAEIAQLMARNHINHLPVFDGKRLVGMVSSTDIFNVK